MCSLASTGGVCCTWLFHIKQKHFVQQHSFLCSNIQRSTFHRRTSVPLSLQKGASFSKLNFFLAFVFLRFHTAEEVHHIPFIPSDSHSGFYFPPFAKANGPPLSPERNDEKPANKNQVLFIVRRNYRSSKFGRT